MCLSTDGDDDDVDDEGGGGGEVAVSVGDLAVVDPKGTWTHSIETNRPSLRRKTAQLCCRFKYRAFITYE